MMRIVLGHLVCRPVLLVAILMVVSAGLVRAEGIRFNRDIRPILSDNCFRCHGPDKAQRQAKLRLDDSAIAGERGAIVPGRPAESLLIKRITSSDPEEVMPPPDSTKQLTARQKKLLEDWIAAGAKYEPHWSYIPPQRAAPPKPPDEAWLKNPIDAFILQGLTSRGMKQSARADKRTLLRRLSLDLTGLPPTPSEIEQFLAAGGGSVDDVIERLLTSPHFGERMAVPWLDLVRFADTVGYHGDQNQNIFPYRDYVIEAFNKNKPFDQFTVEQIAGDLLPNATVEQRIATGFNRVNMMTREGGAQPREYLAKYAADRVRTVSTTWLGSTMACAECHDHKFDPFSARDFYSMAAFFADVKQWGVYQDYKYTPNPDLKGWSNDHPFPPELDVESMALRRRLERLRGQLADLYASLAPQSDVSAAFAFDSWRRLSREFLQEWPDGWAKPAPAVNVTVKKTVAETNIVVAADGSVLLKSKPGGKIDFELSLPAGQLSTIRVELLPHAAHKGHVARGSNLTSVAVAFTAELEPADGSKARKLEFYDSRANRQEERYASGARVIGLGSTWRTAIRDPAERLVATWTLQEPIELEPGDKLKVGLGETTAGCVRVAVSPFASENSLDDVRWQEMLQALQQDWPNPGHLVRRSYLLGTAHDKAAFARYKKLHTDILECREGRTPTLVTVAWEPAVTRVLPRGNWQDESGDVVTPSPPKFLLGGAVADKQELGRLDLARWLVSRDNPLTARAFVNRLWKQFFGTGLSATVDDLGLQGDPPSHPELLDWLAVEFMESGWNTKHVVRLIVQSSAYQQSSNLRSEWQEIDPNNRLLSSQNPRRLEAEFVRDNALFVSGLLNLDVGGPSARPYQPADYYANLQFPDRVYTAQEDDRQYRRGVYTHWQRTFLHPMLANFDAPSREECTALRTVSNTPQQALTLLNDPSFVESARVLAGQLIARTGLTDDDRIKAAFVRVLARDPLPREVTSLRKFLHEQREGPLVPGKPPEAIAIAGVGLAPVPADVPTTELAAWTSLCRVLLNLHEAITVY